MIVDRLENIGHYACLGPNFAAAVRWLASADLCALEPGTYPIDGENVYATVADNRLERETPAFEAHHLYADIQLILGGEERFFLGWSGRETDPKPERDLYFCEVDASWPLPWRKVSLPSSCRGNCTPRATRPASLRYAGKWS